MLDIGWTEMMVVVLVLILVVGPKDLPKVVRTVGQWTAKARRMSREFTSSLEEMGRETELDELRRDLNNVGKIGGGGGVAALEKHVDPDGSMRRAVQSDYANGKAGAMAAPADRPDDENDPADIPAGGDAVAAAAETADADAAASESSENNAGDSAKAGASGA